MTTETATSFDQLHLNEFLLKALNDVGYEKPSPIQAETIPLLLAGRDVLGQAQTGTGKTAAFALPMLSNLDMKQKDPQVLVLAPTRELAIQVAEACQTYAKHMKGFHVLPVYGGADSRAQVRALDRGVHVVVGTPGRVMDHIRRGKLRLDSLKTLVLDEADEMLRMGFIDDVEWILEQTPEQRQIALFSATMPTQIRRIATKYLNDPAQVTIKVKTQTAETIRQRFWPVSGLHKLDALTRILEAEEFDAMIIFVRTKTATTELAEKLEARGYATAPLSGDIQQNQRERTIQNLKNKKLDIIVATDVAARGLDVPRISHVVNYDVPHDTESYVHRIGRTGRAGREGDAILFVAPREKRMLNAIERATNKKIERMELPTTEMINDQRVAKFKQKITDTLAAEDISMFQQMIEQYQEEHNVPAIEIAAVLALLMQGETPFLLSNKPAQKAKSQDDWDNADSSRHSNRDSRNSRDRAPRDRTPRDRAPRERSSRERTPRDNSPPDAGMMRYRLEVGYNHDVKPGNIVGAIANEGNIDSKYIGRINIDENYSTVDLPDDLSRDVIVTLRKARVAGRPLNISPEGQLKREDKEGAPPAREKASRKERTIERSKGKIKLKEKNSNDKTKKKVKKKVRTNRPAIRPGAKKVSD
ncbi:MAG: DEAD/DEAH box helicase [Gammaproteobacteria bacterium]|nr:DEAD/DEAH box helicase [Gammaproteobacteria bacterium]